MRFRLILWVVGKTAKRKAKRGIRKLKKEAKKSQNVAKIELGYHVKDKYYHNIYISRVGKRLCGVIKIKDGSENLGLEYLSVLIKNLKNMDM